MGRKAKAREKARSEHLEKIHSDYCRRHPQRAREERTFRKEQRQRGRDHARRDRLKDGGTPETRAKAAKVRQGSIARAYEAGHITIEQLAAAQQIRGVAERLGREVGFGCFSLETRVDQSRSGTGAFFEALGAVRAEVAYRRWCEWLKGTPAGGAPVLAMVVDEMSITATAMHWGVHRVTARKRLSAALDEWGGIIGSVAKEIDEADLLAMQAGLI